MFFIFKYMYMYLIHALRNFLCVSELHCLRINSKILKSEKKCFVRIFNTCTVCILSKFYFYFCSELIHEMGRIEQCLQISYQPGNVQDVRGVQCRVG